MQLLRSFRWLVVGLFVTTSVAFSCPGNKACQLKNCTAKAEGTVCRKTKCPNKIHNKMCDKQGKVCNKQAVMGKRCIFLQNLRYTLKHLDLKKSDWSDVKIAIDSYKDDVSNIYIATPIKSIQNGKLNRKIFLNAHPMQKKLAAQADLIETILLILNEDQKKRFAMLMGASQFQNKLHPQSGLGHGKKCRKE